MKTLVVYASRETGNTRKLALAIAAALGEECLLAEAALAPPPERFDFIALGFGVYRGWPDGDMRAYMKRCRGRDVGLFMTLGAWPDSEHAFLCMGRAEGLLDNCRVRTRFICQGGYTAEHLERMKRAPASSAHGWTEERAARVAEAMRHPSPEDLAEAARRFAQAAAEAPRLPAARPEKRAAVLAVFGSTIPGAVRAYDAMEQAMRKRRPGIPVFRAYTSAAVRARLSGRAFSLPGVLRQLVLEGYTHADLIAGFLSPGEEYHKVLRDARAFDRELSVRVSRPPLSDLETLKAFLAAVAAGLPPERRPGETVLFMGHGNADGRADFQYLAAAAELARIDADFHLACVEGNLTLDAVLPRLRPGRVWLAPLMLVAGDHAVNDMAGSEPDSWKSRLELFGCECVPVLHGLGENRRVAEFYAGSCP